MAIAIYGGSFDPPHIGHYKIVSQALKDLELEKLIILPNFQNPWKAPTKYPPEYRLKLLKELFHNFNKVEVSDFEISNGYPTKTYESIRYFSKLYSDIYLIIGADNLASLEKWDNFEEINNKVTFVVATRNNIKINKKFLTLNIDINISSTELRNNLDLTKIPEEIRNHFFK